MAEQDEEEKQHDPSQKKMDDARKKGEVAKSADLGTAAAYAGFLIAFMVLGPTLVAKTGALLSNMVGQADSLSTTLFSPGSAPVVGGMMTILGASVFPVLMLPAAVVLLTFMAQRGLVFAPDKLSPKMSRISLLANAKNKFGRGGLFEFAKSFVKLTIYGVVLWVFLLSKTDVILGSAHLSPGMVSSILGKLITDFLLIVVIIATAIGAVDFIWQHKEHLRKNRMSRKELTDENKSQEGDPHVKQQRRQKGYSIAMNQMLADVPDADVVIVNPEHFAVALKWARGGGGAPECVAKGVDEVAFKIREVAMQSGVPIHRDPPCARAIFATVDVGQEILPDHYKAVAAAIRFAETLREKATRGGDG